MIRFARPARPAGWPPAKVARAAADVESAVGAGSAPKFPEHWSDHKPAFEAAQHSKCGFCESPITAVHVGAVEHHAPKGQVQRLVSPGHEAPHSANLAVSRTTSVESAVGYWWLAYDWDNWLYACDRCNSAWKRCLYPVAELPYPVVKQAVPRTRLLIHPFDDGPLEHLDFDDQGFIAARSGSAKGKATIETCGLDRESLRKQRQRVAEDAARHANRLLKAQHDGDPARVTEWAVELRADGDDARPYAGTARAIARRLLGLEWEDVEALAS